MKEEIYDYLISYGFIENDLENIKKNNDKVYFATLKNITDNIEFLEDKGLQRDDIIKIIRKNPYMITTGTRKKELLDEIYSKIFNKDEMKNFITKHSDAYIVNPVKLKEQLKNVEKQNLRNFIDEYFIYN